MPCGMSSLLVQVTVVPAFTVSVCGVKVKLSIDMAPAAGCGAFCAQPGSTTAASIPAVAAPRPAATSALRIVFEMDFETDIGNSFSLEAANRRSRDAARY